MLIPRPGRTQRTRSTSCWLFAILCAGLLAATGCESGDLTTLRRELSGMRQQLADKDRELIAQQVTIDELNARLRAARAFTPEDLEHVFSAEKIVIDGLSGGADYDGKPGDDGVTVYLRPVDRDGDTVKVAGDIHIELFDLAAAEGQTQIGQWDFAASEVSALWYSAFCTQHYTIKCPWPTDPPTGRTLTIVARFTDYLTQAPMSAQATCTVEPRP